MSNSAFERLRERLAEVTRRPEADAGWKKLTASLAREWARSRSAETR